MNANFSTSIRPQVHKTYSAIIEGIQNERSKPEVLRRCDAAPELCRRCRCLALCGVVVPVAGSCPRLGQWPHRLSYRSPTNTQPTKDMSSEPPAKKSRKRSRQSDAEEPSVTQAAGPGVRVEQPNYARGSVWFDDGNIVFVAEGTAFRVYRGILSRNSDVFHDMFTVPQPPDEDKWEGCDVVHFTDSAADWGSILSILFDSSQTTHGMCVFPSLHAIAYAQH